MDITPQIFTAKVTHKRLFPRENCFTYGVYYLALPLPAPEIPNKIVRFDAKDLGYRDGRDPGIYAKGNFERIWIRRKNSQYHAHHNAEGAWLYIQPS